MDRHASVVKSATVFDLAGWIAEETRANGSVRTDAWLVNSPRARAPSPTVKITGNFRLTIDDHFQGWPLTTSIHRQPARLDLDILAQAKPQPNAKLDADSPLRLAIEQALSADEQNEALQSWHRGNQDLLGSEQVRQHWLNWFIAAGIWWMLMVFTSSLAINTLQFGWLLRERHRARRQFQWLASGKCSHCGYDLTGLEFMNGARSAG